MILFPSELRRSRDSKSRPKLNLQYRSPPERKSCFVTLPETQPDNTIQVKYFPRLATEYLDRFGATPNLVPYLKVRDRLELGFSCEHACHVGCFLERRITCFRRHGCPGTFYTSTTELNKWSEATGKKRSTLTVCSIYRNQDKRTLHYKACRRSLSRNCIVERTKNTTLDKTTPSLAIC